MPELTDEEVFGAAELSDADVFGEARELTDADVFGAEQPVVAGLSEEDAANAGRLADKQSELLTLQREARRSGEYWQGVVDRIDRLTGTTVEPLTRPLSGALGRAVDVVVPGEPIVEPTLQQGGIHLPRAGEAKTTGGQIAAGAYNAAAELLSVFSSPDMVALLPAAANKAVLTAWISQMAGHQPERVIKATQLFREGKVQEAVQEVVTGVGELGMAEMGRRHVLAGERLTMADLEGQPRLNINERGEVVDAPGVEAQAIRGGTPVERVAELQRPPPELETRNPKLETPEEVMPRGEEAQRQEVLDRPAPTISEPPPPAPANAPAPAAEPSTTTAIDPRAVPVSEVPVSALKLSKDVPNFKEEADVDTGVVRGQELQGTYERLGTAPIVVWQRLDGSLEVITGRHRLDLARRSGEPTIPAQVVREDAGFTKEHALTFDAEANIRDGQGSVKDYAHYFRNSRQRLTSEEAEARGLLARAKGKAGFDLGQYAADDIYALYAADKITEGQALAIARAAPGNADAQRLGVKYAALGKPPEFIGNVIKAVVSETGGRAEALDLFGRDDTALRQAEEQATRAASLQKEIREQVTAISGASKKPEVARKLGVDVKDPAALAAKVSELRGELQRWENWPLHPDLVARTRGTEAKVAETLRQPSQPIETRDVPLQVNDLSDFGQRPGSIGWARITSRVYADILENGRWENGNALSASDRNRVLARMNEASEVLRKADAAAAERSAAREAADVPMFPELQRKPLTPEEAARAREQDRLAENEYERKVKRHGDMLRQMVKEEASPQQFEEWQQKHNRMAASFPAVGTPTYYASYWHNLLRDQVRKVPISVEANERIAREADARIVASPDLTLAKPETIAEQAARVEREAQARELAEQARAAQEREATAKRKMLEKAAAPLGGDLGSAGQGGLFAEPGQQEIFQTKPPAPGKQELVLWGRQGGGDWLKLTDRTSAAEMKRWEKDGWEVLRYPKYSHPGDINKPSINTGNLGELGMGGAKPGEMAANPNSPTSIKNATVDVERQRRGLPAAMQPARRGFEQVWDEAMALVDRDPAAQDRLIAELKARPRALTDLEDALLLQRQIDLQNEYGKQTRSLADAYDDARRFPDRLEAVERHKAIVQEVSDRLLELYDVNKSAGTATGRGLNARKLMAYEDFTLAQMELDARAAKEGRPLTDAERQQLTASHERIADLQKRFDDYVAKAEQDKAQRAATEAVADLTKRAGAEPPLYTPEVKSLAERIVETLEREADAARARLKQKFARTSAGVDPTILYDLSVVGASHIARGALDLARFSERMLSEFGEGVRELLPQVWSMANSKLDRDVARTAGSKSPDVRRAVRRMDPTEQRAALLEGLGKAVGDGRPLQELGDYIRKLALNFVRSGVRTRDALIDAVHGELTKLIPEVTRRETMDAISGYGDFKPLDPNEIKAQLRALKGEMQQVAKLEDITARQPPLKTGLERRAVGDEERRLIQQVNEAKRRYGVVSTDPARQLKSALDSVKTRLNNQIADYEYQIATRQKIVRDRSKPPFDAESELLKTRRDALKQQFDALFPRPELTDAQRAATLEKQLERDIAEYERRISAGDLAPRKAGESRELRTDRLDALRTRRDALRADLASLRDAAVNTPEARLADLKARMLTRAAEYRDRLARGDFEPPRRRDVHLDNEALRLKAGLEKAKSDWHHALAEKRLANRSFLRKALDVPADVVAAQRQLWTSFDLSAVFRQGGILSGSHPVLAARAGGKMVRALSEKQAEIAWQAINDRPNARNASYYRSKLFLSDPHRFTPSAVEENLRARWLHKVPGIKQSNQTYATYLNELRASSFDAIKESVEARGTPLNEAELRGLANYINIATGRGDLGKFAPAANLLSLGLFSPRLLVSRFQYLLGQPLLRAGSGRMRRALAIEYGRSLGALGVVLALGVMAGATVEEDPRSSDFGKLKFGNTRVDMMGGLSQASVFLARVLGGKTKTAAGEMKDLINPRTPTDPDWGDTWVNFARSKRAPWISTLSELRTGRDFFNRRLTRLEMARNALAPLSVHDVAEVLKEQGMSKGAAISLMSLLGAGVSVQEDPDLRETTSAIMRRLRGGTPEEREALRQEIQQTLRENPPPR